MHFARVFLFRVWSCPWSCDAESAQSLQDFTAVRVLEDAAETIWAAAWSRNLLAIAGDDQTVRIYDADQDWRDHGSEVCRIPKQIHFESP